MKILSFDFGWGAVLLAILLALLAAVMQTGCKSSNAELVGLAKEAAQIAKDSELDYDVELTLSPDGAYSFGPSLNIQNRSIARVRFHGQFARPAATPPAHKE